MSNINSFEAGAAASYTILHLSCRSTVLKNRSCEFSVTRMRCDLSAATYTRSSHFNSISKSPFGKLVCFTATCTPLNHALVGVVPAIICPAASRPTPSLGHDGISLLLGF
jgi:hypothetical protein